MMKSATILIFAIAFFLGAYASFLENWTAVYVLLGIGLGLSILIPELWRMGPKRWVYLLGVVIALFACLYVKVRTPQPQAEDISKYAPLSNVIVRGQVIAPPSLTRSERGRFVMAVKEINPSGKSQRSGIANIPSLPSPIPTSEATANPQTEPQTDKFVAASGNLYVTVPLIEITGLRAGQEVELSGRLYLPSRADNFGAFDFKTYLARQGIFAGLSGRSLTLQSDPPSFGEWWFISSIVRAHVMGAGIPEGALLSSLVLGGRAVDLPSDLKDEFVQAGLAAILAASGFQVTLVLGAAIAIGRKGSLKVQFVIGCICLGGYLLLTGASPSILRAVIMGFGSLVGLVVQRRSRPVVALILTAVVLLIYQPLWIWDLGFQFSFLATFGLITSARPIAQYWQWLPPAIADLISVPIAAYIWTLPLQILVFGKIAIYTLLANILTTPLVTISTYGGIISGFLAVIFVPLGAAIAWLFYPLLHWTIQIAEWINTLPNASTSVGTINIWQMLAAYALLLSIWLLPWFWKMQRWLIPTLMVSILLFVPNAIAQANTFAVTIPSFNDVPIMLIKNQGKVVLINSGDQQFASFTLQPFLQKQGINRINWAISTDTQPSFSDGWNVLSSGTVAIEQFRDTSIGVIPQPYQNLQRALAAQKVPLESMQSGAAIKVNDQIEIQLLDRNPDIFKFKIGSLSWLLLATTDQKSQQAIIAKKQLLPQLAADVLWWTGGQIETEILQAINPKVAIASATSVIEPMVNQLYENKVRVFWTGRDGAMQWSPEQEFYTLRDEQDARSPL
ncbi:MAG: ComEC/Rec2 family competence protein [Pseudanabaenaceae cyanobacterium bins.39]|nr:ComEC/Rec2 family competence protein [Pseudanabaenaceae cyanobacterium bins.39]